MAKVWHHFECRASRVRHLSENPGNDLWSRWFPATCHTTRGCASFRGCCRRFKCLLLCCNLWQPCRPLQTPTPGVSSRNADARRRQNYSRPVLVQYGIAPHVHAKLTFCIAHLACVFSVPVRYWPRVAQVAHLPVQMVSVLLLAWPSLCKGKQPFKTSAISPRTKLPQHSLDTLVGACPAISLRGEGSTAPASYQ